eukprot:TRINITY_DN5911_c0_g1_i3.p1 TRINITY_DN5911_c0_g1~~TRINITY_DN5911_c0_g1_i3.p1  ORF type:complete len:169 (+),score=41.19 TRINITY_DN5911_c0_g1_i3:76-582(+)
MCLCRFLLFFFLMIRRPPRSTHCISSAASDVYKRQVSTQSTWDSINLAQHQKNGGETSMKAVPLALKKGQKMNVLEFAIQMEQDGEKYYREQAELYTQNNLNVVCRMLADDEKMHAQLLLSLIHISEPTRLGMISYAVFCLKKKKNKQKYIRNNTTTQHTLHNDVKEK